MLSKLYYKFFYKYLIFFQNLMYVPLVIGIYKAFRVLKIKTLAGRLLLAGCLIQLLLLVISTVFPMDAHTYIESLAGGDSALTMQYWNYYSLILNLIGSIGLGLIVGSAFADRNPVRLSREEDKIDSGEEPVSTQPVVG